MKFPIPLLVLTASLVGAIIGTFPLDAQNNAAAGDELLPLVQSITAQQKLIEENQTKLETSLTTVQENVRQAKIFIARAGSGKAAK